MKIEFDLLTNALDSIDHAIELVAWGEQGNQSEARRLKQAIQSIAHGVELMLKERLKRIHPSLLWESVDKYPNLNARTITAEGAMTRLVNIGGLKFEPTDIELIRSLRATRNAIEHHAWTTTKQEADAIIGKALEFTLHFSKSELAYDFFGYRTRKDDSLQALVKSNAFLAEAMTLRLTPTGIDTFSQPRVCSFCRAKAVDPATAACRLCGHWQPSRGFDDFPDEDEIPF
jgi:hypothetical protein